MESGQAEFCQKGLLQYEDVRSATALLLRAIVDKGECKDGKPSVSDWDEENDWVTCRHELELEIDGLGDALEIESAGIVFGSRVEKFIETRGIE